MSSEVPRQPLHDPRALRALTHPVRLALLEALDREGPLTATQAADLLGESPANCSFHLRTLAKYGFVEEAPGGTGRQRPWQARRVISTIESQELTPDGRLAAQALVDMLRERQLGWLRRWDASRDSMPAQWRTAADEMQTVLHLTAAELAELTATISAAVERYIKRADPPGSVPVSFTVQAFPLAIPPAPVPAPEH
jgi:predicted ArsR family transcriptional regulator